MTFWVECLRRAGGQRRASRCAPKYATRRRTFRPALERLEDRTVLDGITWSAAWSAQFSPPPEPQGFIQFLEGPLQTFRDNSDVIAANLVAIDNSPPESPSPVIEPYTLTLALTDQASGLSTDLTFEGNLQGNLTRNSVNLTNTFVGQPTQTVLLGGNQYTVSVDGFSPPSPPGSPNPGAIDASVTVAPAIPPAPGPFLAVNNPIVLADNGAVAVNGGTYGDNTDGATVTLAASAGTIVQNADGTWTWSQPTPAGAAQAQRVVITAQDDQGLTTSTTFWLNVNQVFTVTNTADSGPGSLRQAISDANASSEATDSLGNLLPAAIAFDLPADDPNHLYYQARSREAAQTTGLDLNDRTTTTTTDDSQIADLNANWAHSWWSIPIGPDPLPAFTHPIFLDGYSQPGSQANDAATGGLDTVLRIELDDSEVEGQGSTGPGVLTLATDGSTVQGLAVNGFPGGNGIMVESSDNHVQGDFIGTDVSGTLAPDGLPNYNAIAVGPSYGIQINGGETATDNVIGTDGNGVTDAAERNLISANNYGVLLRGPNTAGNTVAGNLIGTDRTGTQPLGNWAGVATLGQSQGDVIGTNGTGPDTTAEGNVLSANRFGILFGAGIPGPAEQGGLVAGNFIGTDATGTAPLGNLFAGVAVGFGTIETAIGGDTPDLANVIAFNAGTGVAVLDFRGTPDGIAIEGNSIHDNGLGNSTYGITPGGLGIDLGGSYPAGPDGVTVNDSQGHAGPNHFQDFPVISSVTHTPDQLTVAGTVAGAPGDVLHLEFFASTNPGPPDAEDSGTFGEGQTFLGSTDVTLSADGRAAFTALLPGAVPDGEAILSATATDLTTGDTSEFSQDVTLPPPTPDNPPSTPTTPQPPPVQPANPPPPGSSPAAPGPVTATPPPVPVPPADTEMAPVAVAVTETIIPVAPIPTIPAPADRGLAVTVTSVGVTSGLRAAAPFLGRSDGTTPAPPATGGVVPQGGGEAVASEPLPAALTEPPPTLDAAPDRPLGVRLGEGPGLVLGMSPASQRGAAGSSDGEGEAALLPLQVGSKALQLGSSLVDTDDSVVLIQTLTSQHGGVADATSPAPVRGLGHAEEEALDRSGPAQPGPAAAAPRSPGGGRGKVIWVGSVILTGGVAVLAWRWWARRRGHERAEQP